MLKELHHFSNNYVIKSEEILIFDKKKLVFEQVSELTVWLRPEEEATTQYDAWDRGPGLYTPAYPSIAGPIRYL